MVNAVSKWLDAEGIKPANFYFERFAPKETTGGDAETGAPADAAKIAAEGDRMSRGEAVSSLETGRLDFRKEDSFAPGAPSRSRRSSRGPMRSSTNTSL